MAVAVKGIVSHARQSRSRSESHKTLVPNSRVAVASYLDPDLHGVVVAAKYIAWQVPENHPDRQHTQQRRQSRLQEAGNGTNQIQ